MADFDSGLIYWMFGRPGGALGRLTMKVRASVKPRCERCKIIRRNRVVLIICTNPNTNRSKGRARRRWEESLVARIAGVDIPRDKKVWVSLTYIYGIGPTLSRRVLDRTNVNPEARVKDLRKKKSTEFARSSTASIRLKATCGVKSI